MSKLDGRYLKEGSVSADKIRLLNDEFLKGTAADGITQLDLFKVSALNTLIFGIPFAIGNTPVNPTDATNKQYVDAQVANSVTHTNDGVAGVLNYVNTMFTEVKDINTSGTPLSAGYAGSFKIGALIFNFGYCTVAGAIATATYHTPFTTTSLFTTSVGARHRITVPAGSGGSTPEVGPIVSNVTLTGARFTFPNTITGLCGYIAIGV